MANLCENSLTIFGSKETIESFINKVEIDDEHLSSARHLPMPEKNQDGQYVRITDMRLAYETTLFKEEETYATYEFDSRCYPPLVWFSELTSEHENASFILEYDEPLYYGSGRIIVIEGVLDEKNCFKVKQLGGAYSELLRRYDSAPEYT